MRYVVKRRNLKGSAWWIFDTKHREYVVGNSKRGDAEQLCADWNLEEREERAREFNEGFAKHAARFLNYTDAPPPQDVVREMFALRGLALVSA